MIENIFEEIREICNHPWKRELLFQDKIKWNKLWSSLDVIEDSQIAIDDYTNLYEFNTNTNGYLYIYGILQALNLQQDALVNLNKALFDKRIDFKNEYPKLYNIRENRNNSIGHPTDRGNESSFHHITRGSIKKQGFEMISRFPKSKEDTKFEEVNILSCIEIQNKLLNEILNNTTEKLKSEFDSHMNKFKEKKLIDIVPTKIDYHFSKLYEDCRDYFPLVKINFEMIFKIYNSIKQGIVERYSSLSALPGIELNTKMLDYLFDRLNRDLIKDRIEDKLELRIFIDALKSHFDELKSMIIEIDEEFSS